MRIKIKEVPRDKPNAEGIWRECEVRNDFAIRNYKTTRQVWDAIKSLRGEGKEIVAYEVID